MKLSEKAWELSSPIINAIKTHPFNQQLMSGILNRDIFTYYIEQDSLYLNDFSRCLAIIASKAPTAHIQHFLDFAKGALLAEQETVHYFFKQLFDIKETNKLTLATLSYTSYLLRTCSMEPIEVAIAAVLPCFWVYREIGLFIAKSSGSNNPYAQWIEVYSSDDFNHSVEKAISIFDELGRHTSEVIQQKMLDAFYKSTCLEWHFWNDAYNKTYFDNIL